MASGKIYLYCDKPKITCGFDSEQEACEFLRAQPPTRKWFQCIPRNARQRIAFLAMGSYTADRMILRVRGFTFAGGGGPVRGIYKRTIPGSVRVEIVIDRYVDSYAEIATSVSAVRACASSNSGYRESDVVELPTVTLPDGTEASLRTIIRDAGNCIIVDGDETRMMWQLIPAPTADDIYEHMSVLLTIADGGFRERASRLIEEFKSPEAAVGMYFVCGGNARYYTAFPADNDTVAKLKLAGLQSDHTLQLFPGGRV